MTTMITYQELAESVIEGDDELVVEQVKDLIEQGKEPLEIINQGLIGGMNVVGVRFKAGDMFMPEVLMSAGAMAAGVDIVKPLIPAGEIGNKIKVVLGTVEGDLHDIGKNLVRIMMESSGIEVTDIGVDISPDKFVDAVQTYNPQILALSALLTTTMPALKTTIEAVEAAGMRDELKIIVGGAPVTQEYANSIGADGYAPDAASAADLCKEIVR